LIVGEITADPVLEDNAPTTVRQLQNGQPPPVYACASSHAILDHHLVHLVTIDVAAEGRDAPGIPVRAFS
jgi:hypothetical protein